MPKKKLKTHKKSISFSGNSSPTFGGVPVSQVLELQSVLPKVFYEELLIVIAVVLLLVVCLGQIRSYNLGVPIGELDQLKSVKFYKEKLLGAGKLLASTLAIVRTIDFISPGSTSADLEADIKNYADGMKGNVPVLENVNRDNLVPFRLGLMGRILGQLQSCPMTNPSLIGFKQSALQDLSVEDVCGMVGVKDVEKVKAMYHDLVGPNHAFEEPQITSGPSLVGLTKVEHGLYGENMVRTREIPAGAKTSVGFGGMIQSNSVNARLIRETLSRIEYLQYQAAKKNVNIEALRRLNQLVTERSSIAGVQSPSGNLLAQTPTTPGNSGLGVLDIAKKLPQNASKQIFLDQLKSMCPGVSIHKYEEVTKAKLQDVYFAVLANKNLNVEDVNKLLG